MDVTTMNIGFTLARSSGVSADIFPSKNTEMPDPPSRRIESSFDFHRVVMDLDEVKSFLYMVVGGGIPQVIHDERVGGNVNRFA